VAAEAVAAEQGILVLVAVEMRSRAGMAACMAAVVVVAGVHMPPPPFREQAVLVPPGLLLFILGKEQK
jgi:hypothetical protein